MTKAKILLAMAALFLPRTALPQDSKPATAAIDAPAGTEVVLTLTGEGAQVYTCNEGHWKLKGPDAKLLDDHGQAIGAHFEGPTWRLQDGSEVKGKAIANQPSPDAASVPWLLLQAVSGSGTLAKVAYIRRTETHGGVPPSMQCDAGETRIPYSAKYSFYKVK